MNVEVINWTNSPLQYMTEGAAALDLRAVSPLNATEFSDLVNPSVVIWPGETVKFGSGLRLSMPEGLAAVILPRSSSANLGLRLANTVGLIDSDYQGEIIVALKNESNVPVTIHRGDRIAQMMFVPYVRPIFKMVVQFSIKTERGSGGFGSTGVS